jgi:Transglycosylase
MFEKALKALFVGMAATAVLFIAFCYGIYAHTLRELPANSKPSAKIYALHIQQKFVRANGFPWPAKTIKLRPTWFFEMVIFNKLNDDYSFSDHPARLPSYAGRILLQRKLTLSKHNADRQLQQYVFTVWVSRHWSSSEIINTLLAESYFGQNIYGIDAASSYYFNLPLDQLRDDELYILFATMNGSAIFNPWCRQERVISHVKAKSGLTPSFDRLNPANAPVCK